MKFCLLSVVLFAWGAAASGRQREAIEVWPVDEAVIDPDLLATRTAVIDALRRHDIERLMALMGDDVYHYGQGSATAEEKRANLRRRFIVDWESNADRHEYTELLTALSMGGSFTTTRGSVKDERQFCAPYVYSAFPVDLPDVVEPDDWDHEPTSYWLLIAKNVPVRRKPGVQSPVVARVNYRPVRMLLDELDSQGKIWEHIVTTDGIDGYVPRNLLRSPADYYMCFGERAGGWRITEFGEGRYPDEP